MNIILASQSPSRKALLEQAGIKFQVKPSFIDETKIPVPENKKELCLKIAQAKTEFIYKKFPDSLIIGSDQQVFFEEQHYGKAHTKERAKEFLSKLQGQSHQLINGLCMKYQDQTFTYTSISKMRFRMLTSVQIDNYLNQNSQVLKSAGCYQLEGMGIGLFTKMETEDFSSILGLPMIQVINQLIKWGYPYLDQSTDR